jgi:hypothetical protein
MSPELLSEQQRNRRRIDWMGIGLPICFVIVLIISWLRILFSSKNLKTSESPVINIPIIEIVATISVRLSCF